MYVSEIQVRRGLRRWYSSPTEYSEYLQNTSCLWLQYESNATTCSNAQVCWLEYSLEASRELVVRGRICDLWRKFLVVGLPSLRKTFSCLLSAQEAKVMCKSVHSAAFHNAGMYVECKLVSPSEGPLLSSRCRHPSSEEPKSVLEARPLPREQTRPSVLPGK